MSFDQQSGSSMKSQVMSKAPMIAGGVAGLFLVTRVMKAIFGRGKPGFKNHYHEALEHSHEHVHVTHDRTDPDKGVGGWEHLTSTHSHRHNHAALEHSHRPHRNLDKEHQGEAHVHDHEHPTTS